MDKNFYVICGFENKKTVYRVLACERIAKIRGNDIIATCDTVDDAEWLCVVLECYWLLSNKLAHSLFPVINSHVRDNIKNKQN